MKPVAITQNQQDVITAYHGSGIAIDKFSYEFTNIGNDQNGSGFYFTTDITEAAGYTSATLNGQPKPGGQDNPTIHRVNLHLKNSLNVETCRDLTAKEVRAIISKSPCLEDCLWDWGDINHYGVQSVLDKAVNAYVPPAVAAGEPVKLIKSFHSLSNDFFPGETEAFNRAIEEVLGYDSVVEHYPKVGTSHYVAFFVEQIEIIERTPIAEFNRQPEPEMTP